MRDSERRERIFWNSRRPSAEHAQQVEPFSRVVVGTAESESRGPGVLRST